MKIATGFFAVTVQMVLAAMVAFVCIPPSHAQRGPYPFFMPAGTPKATVDRFREAVQAVMAMADVKEQLASLGFEPADTSGDEFRRLVANEIKQWTKVLQVTNLKLE